MVTAIILSKDRPAQLHLLLESIRRNAGRHIKPVVIYKGDPELYKQAAPDVLLLPETNLEQQIRDEIELAADYVCFMCDDGILYRPYRGGAENVLHYSPETLCASLRLGFNGLQLGLFPRDLCRISATHITVHRAPLPAAGPPPRPRF